MWRQRMADLADYVDAHRDEFLRRLVELLRIPSVSAQSPHAPDVRRCAEWLAAHMRQLGIGNVQVLETGGHPAVYGEWLQAPGTPTALVYGHYDVQPVD